MSYSIYLLYPNFFTALLLNIWNYHNFPLADSVPILLDFGLQLLLSRLCDAAKPAPEPDQIHRQLDDLGLFFLIEVKLKENRAVEVLNQEVVLIEVVDVGVGLA